MPPSPISPAASPEYSLVDAAASYDWWMAKDECESNGGSLPVIQSAQENADLVAFMTTNSVARVWLGLTDSYQEGYYEWAVSDEHRFPLGTYTNWAPGHPSTTSFAHDCTDMPSALAQWRHRSCNQLKPLICRIHATGRRRLEEIEEVPALPVSASVGGDASGTNSQLLDALL